MHKAGFIFFMAASSVTAWGQAQSDPVADQKPDRSSAYYHYALAHMYAGLAGAHNHRDDFVKRAVENYKLAISEDPASPRLKEELSVLTQAGRMRPPVFIVPRVQPPPGEVRPGGNSKEP